MNQRVQFASGVFWSYVQSLGARGITSVTFIVVGLYVDPTEFGLYALVSALLMFVELVCEQALAQSLVQIEQTTPAQLEVAFMLALIVGLLITAGLLLGAPHLARWFGQPDLLPLLRIAAVCPLLIAAAAVPIGLLRRAMQFKVLARRTVTASALSSVLGISLVISGFGAFGLLAQAVCYYAVSLWVLWRHCDWRPTWRLRGASTSLPSIARLSLANLAHKLFDFGETRGVELLVGATAGIEVLGVFAFASKIAQTAFQTLASPALEVVFAGVARASPGASALEVIRTGQLLVGTVPAAGLLWLSLAAEPLLSLIYGDRWAAAALPLSILAIAYLLRSLLYVFGATLLARRATREVLTGVAVRSVVSTGVAYAALFMSCGASGAAWGFLAGAVVAPLSIHQTSRIFDIPMSGLAEVSVKVLVAVAISLTAYSMLVWTIGTGSYAALAAATGGALIFLGIAAGLNAGSISHSLAPVIQRGGMARVLTPVLALARWLLNLRERARLAWFSQTMRMAIARESPSSAAGRRVMIVPGDTTDLTGSLGDEVLLRGLASLVDPVNWVVVVDEDFRSSSPLPHHALLRAWNGLRAGWVLGRAAARVSAVYVIGADVMDGFYRAGASQQRIRLLSLMSRAGVPCTLTGFSFNERPHPAVLSDFHALPDSVRICLRDSLSLDRFERVTGRRATLVADLAFLVGEAPHSPVAQLVAPWAEQERVSGRRLVGININPHVVAHLPDGSEAALADSMAACCLQLISEGCSILLIPHDFRPAHTDLRAMSRVASRLGDGPHVLFLKEPFAGQEIRNACRELDLILSARMHLAIAALAVGVPACGIQYQGKFEGLFRHFGFGADVFIAPEDAMDPTKLHTFIARQLGRVAEMRVQVQARLPAVRVLAAKNAALA